MNELGVSLLWCAVQVTSVVLLGGLLCLAARRIGSAAGSVVALTTLSIVVVLTLLAVSPWPRWWPEEGTVGATAVSAARSAESISPADTRSPAPAGTRPTASSSASLADFWTAFQDELSGRPLPAAAGRLRWPALLAAVFLLGAACGLLRLLAGLIAIRRLRRNCLPIDDAALREQVDVLQAELCCPRRIELRESAGLSTAATVGWRRPLILLPLEWRQWTPVERRAVLAHEIAHIRNNDFLSTILAQLGLVLHFYHPLVHWLTGRLRLEQELAADARAAALAGGQRSYLTILAEMALRQADRPVSWPARTFLPTRGTFLRRIEMLRDQQQHVARLSAPRKLATVALLVAAGIAAAGLRAPERHAVAQAPGASGSTALAPADADAGKIDLSLVPSEAGIVLALRPAALFAKPEMQKVVQTLNEEAKLQEQLGLSVEEIEQVTLVAMRTEQLPGQPPMPPQTRGMILRAARPHDWAALAAEIAPNAVESRYAGQTYYKVQGGACYYRPDDRTIVVDQEGNLYRYILRAQGLPGEFAWATVWQDVEGSIAAAALDVGVLRMLFTEEMMQQPQAAPFLAFAPLWEETTAIVAGVTLDDKLAVRAVLATPTEEGRQKVQETSQALLTLAGNMLKGARQQANAAAAGQPDAAVAVAFFDQFAGILKSAQVDVAENSVVVTAAGEAGVVELVASIVPALGAAREAARRAASMNNLKQIALAMHNYADVNKSFPPAVLYSANGTPYSWRVALLPYLEQDALYRSYNFNEPWDGPNNGKLVQQMPAVYRDPNAQNAPGVASYFVLTGPSTMFTDRVGAKFQDILDGTSNTIMAVEAVRDLPWTQPLDIPYDPQGAMPELGGFRDGGFNAAFGDGSVRFIDAGIDEATLRALFTKAGGEVIAAP